jgi:hypothetical protein
MASARKSIPFIVPAQLPARKITHKKLAKLIIRRLELHLQDGQAAIFFPELGCGK